MKHIVIRTATIWMLTILDRIQRFGVPPPLLQRYWCRDSVKKIAIPAWRWLVLLRVAGKRPPQRSNNKEWTGSGVQRLVFSSD